jgi:hypothetical protein
LALRIAQLLEDHTDREVRDAVQMLREHGYNSTLLEYLAGDRSTVATSKQRGSRLKAKPIHESTSRAVLRLREADPEKYRLLSDFDVMIRRGQLLPTNEDLRRLGERVSKDFEPGKSRKETISGLMAVLADRPVKEIEQLIEFAASFGVAGDSDEFQRLAQFLITGKNEI